MRYFLFPHPVCLINQDDCRINLRSLITSIFHRKKRVIEVTLRISVKDRIEVQHCGKAIIKAGVISVRISAVLRIENAQSATSRLSKTWKEKTGKI